MKVCRKSDKVCFESLEVGELFEIGNGDLCMKVYPFKWNEGIDISIVNAVNLDRAQLIGVLNKTSVTRKDNFVLKEE